MRGIKACGDNLREKFPSADLVIVKVFPTHAPGNRFDEDIKRVNAAVNGVDLDAAPKIHVLDISADMVEADGALKKGLFSGDTIHLTQDGGYDLYARRLTPLIEKLLGGRQPPASDAPAAAQPQHPRRCRLPGIAMPTPPITTA